MLQIINGNERKYREKEKELSCNGLSKYTTETQWKNDTSCPGFGWHSGFSQNPLRTGIYFPSVDVFWREWTGAGGGNSQRQERKWPGGRVMANIFWIGAVLVQFSQGRGLSLWLVAAWCTYLFALSSCVLLITWHHQLRLKHQVFSLKCSALATDSTLHLCLWQAGHTWKSWFFKDIWNWRFSKQKYRGSADKWHHFWDSGPNVQTHTPSLHLPISQLYNLQ